MTRYRSALVAALACASLLAITQYAEAKARHGGAKSSSSATAKASKAKSAAKKPTAGKSKDANKDGKSTSGKAAAVPTPPDGPGSSSASTTVKVWAPGTGDTGTGEAQPPSAPLAQAPALHASEADVALVKSAIETLRKGGASKATAVAAGISDPVARKLVEWIILRSDHSGADSARYTAFMTANPSWPSLGAFRRRAEAMLWVENAKPARVMSFFDGSPPQSAMGRLVLARAMSAQGDTEGAKALVRDTWRNDPIPADVEKQVLERYPDLLSRADHKARMEKRLVAADKDSAMRAANTAGGRRSRDRPVASRARQQGRRQRQEAARRRAGGGAPGSRLLLARVYLLRHDEKIAEAAQVMLSAPTDLAQVHDGEDGGSSDGSWRASCSISAMPVRPIARWRKPRSRPRKTPGSSAFSWLGGSRCGSSTTRRRRRRTSPASRTSAHTPRRRRARITGSDAPRKCCIGPIRRAPSIRRRRVLRRLLRQLARARLASPRSRSLRRRRARTSAPRSERLELVRAVEILYALKETALVIPLMADLGGKLDDVGALSALGELAEQQQDARGMLHLGKAALARGLPLDYYAFPAVGVPRYSPIGPGIDNAMLFAIIRQESAFNPADWSRPGDGPDAGDAGRRSDTCKRFGCSYDVKRLKNDMPYNLQVGTAELGGVMQDYRSNYILAFAGYNAGRGACRNRSRSSGIRATRRSIRSTGSSASRSWKPGYVQRVMENMQVYRTRFGATPLTIETDLRRGASSAAAR